jgi:hypothetical protein
LKFNPNPKSTFHIYTLAEKPFPFLELVFEKLKDLRRVAEYEQFSPKI